MIHFKPKRMINNFTCYAFLKKLAFFSVLFSVLLPLRSNPVSPAKAQRFSLAFLSQNSGIPISSVTLAHAETSGSGDTLYYIFNINSNDGFIIVSADDAAKPVIGYTTSGQFKVAPLNSSVGSWLGRRKNELLYIRSTKLQASAEITEQWKALGIKKNKLGNSVMSYSDISPLVSTTWDQSPYYNADCPGGSVTGCVATAMAQIMKFWAYPTTGTGSSSYCDCTPAFTENYGTQSANYGSTTYNWSNMPDNVSSANADVATLMYQCGVSVNMNYSPTSSGSAVSKTDNPSVCAQVSYVKYFGYDSTSLRPLAKISCYTDSAWIANLYNELALGRPIQYEGDDATYGGHTWVCDGFQASTNFFHMNWGWSGQYDGYFSVDALNPDGYNFALNDAVLIGIQPLHASAPVSDFTAVKTEMCGGGSTVSFTDLSSNYATSWNWSFPGGTPSTSTAKNPTVTYANSGSYNVSLTAGNGHGTGSTNSKTGFITIISSATASACVPECEGTSVYFADYLFGITNVTLNTINNTTGGTYDDGGYVNFSCTGGTTTLQSSKTYTISVTVGTENAENIAVYIDYNNNGVFTDPGELVYSASGFTGTTSGTFTTPASPTTGTYLRMRVLDDYFSIADACSPLSYGQAEDYGVYFSSGGAAPVAAFTANKTSVCAGGSVNFTDESTNSPTSWAWTFAGGNPSTSTSQNPSVTYSSSGTYNVTLTASNGSGSNSLTKTGYIMVNSNPTASVGTDPVSCNGGSTGSATLTAGSGTPAFTYLWNSGQTTSTISNVAAGTYVCTVTDSKGCVASSSAVVSQPGAIQINLTPTNTSTCGGSDGSVSSSISGGTAPYNYDWNTGSTATSISGLVLATYSLSITDAHGCTGSGSAFVNGTGCSGTELASASCGSTLTSLTGVYIYCNAVTNAQNYKYLFTNSSLGYSQTQFRGDVTNDFNMSWVTGLQYATTYNVYVASEVGGVWSGYGSACTITTPALPQPVNTELSSAYCGATLTSLTEIIYCNAVPFAQNYCYRFANSSLGYSQAVNRGDVTNDFNLSWVTGLEYSTTYSVSVCAEVFGNWGTYSTVCTITTPSLQTTEVSAAFCGSTVTSSSEAILVNEVPNATNYKFLLTNSGLGYSQAQFSGSSAYEFYLGWYTGLLANNTYDVQVSAEAGGLWTGYGSVCTISLGGSYSVAGPPPPAGNKANQAQPQLTEASDFKLYPNPVSQESAVVIDPGSLIDSQHPGQLVIYNLLGAELLSLPISSSALLYLSIDNRYKPGMYLVEIVSGERRISKRMIVQ